MDFQTAEPAGKPLDEKWSLTTHVPHEIITSIFRWLPLDQVRTFQSACRLLGQVLRDPYFHSLNIRTIYGKLKPTEEVVGIRYSVFPHLDEVSTSWEIVEFYGATRTLSYPGNQRGITLVARRMAERLNLPVNIANLNVRTLMRYRRGYISHMYDKNINRRGGYFDPASETLVFWPPGVQQPPQQTTVNIFVPAYRTPDSYQPDRICARIRFWFTVHQCEKHAWYTWRDVYHRKDSKIEIYELVSMLAAFMRDHSFANLVVRRLPVDQKETSSAASIFVYNPDGTWIPFDPSTERLYFVLVGVNETPSTQVQAEWDRLLREGNLAFEEKNWSTAIAAFRDLITAKLDVYGFKDPRAYENHLEIAEVYLAQQLYRKASASLCTYFEHGPQGSSELAFEKATRIMESLEAFGNCDARNQYDLVQSE
ncbi:hypothetical protein BDR26DRAFT_853199 [Obelidium mucronatum]|nr:hypothetical protein BDR26DRAFT_853199 [Obelidium mucronatum]